MSKHSLLPFQRLTALPTALQDTHPHRCQSTLQTEAGAAALFFVPWQGGSFPMSDLTQYFIAKQDPTPDPRAQKKL